MRQLDGLIGVLDETMNNCAIAIIVVLETVTVSKDLFKFGREVL